MQICFALSIIPFCFLFSWVVYDFCERAIKLQFKQENLENSTIYFILEGEKTSDITCYLKIPQATLVFVANLELSPLFLYLFIGLHPAEGANTNSGVWDEKRGSFT